MTALQGYREEFRLVQGEGVVYVENGYIAQAWYRFASQEEREEQEPAAEQIAGDTREEEIILIPQDHWEPKLKVPSLSHLVPFEVADSIIDIMTSCNPDGIRISYWGVGDVEGVDRYVAVHELKDAIPDVRREGGHCPVDENELTLEVVAILGNSQLVAGLPIEQKWRIYFDSERARIVRERIAALDIQFYRVAYTGLGHGRREVKLVGFYRREADYVRACAILQSQGREFTSYRLRGGVLGWVIVMPCLPVAFQTSRQLTLFDLEGNPSVEEMSYPASVEVSEAERELASRDPTAQQRLEAYFYQGMRMLHIPQEKIELVFENRQGRSVVAYFPRRTLSVDIGLGARAPPMDGSELSRRFQILVNDFLRHDVVGHHFNKRTEAQARQMSVDHFLLHPEELIVVENQSFNQAHFGVVLEQPFLNQLRDSHAHIRQLNSIKSALRLFGRGKISLDELEARVEGRNRLRGIASRAVIITPIRDMLSRYI